MHVARRVYLYLVSYISLLVLLTGAAQLLRLMLELGLGLADDVRGDASSLREAFSSAGALLVVGGVVWGLHWWGAQRTVAPARPLALDERRSVLRQGLIYAVLLTAAWQVASALQPLLQGLLEAGPVAGGTRVRQAVSGTLPQLLIYGLAWAYYWRVQAADARVAPARRRAATLRRWYFYLVNAAALSALMFALAELARTLWERLTTIAPLISSDTTGRFVPIAASVATILTAGAGWAGHWTWVQRQTRTQVAEQQGVLRPVYLYAMLFQMITVALSSLAGFLHDGLRLLLGSNPLVSGDSLLTAAGRPLLTAAVYGVFWAYHWQVVRGAAVQGQAALPRPAAIRRLYHHLVAAIGLALLAGGGTDLLRLLFDLGLRGAATTDLSRAAWGDQISLCATLLSVGALVWGGQWARLQQEARGADGADERQALSRRIYLYLALFAAVITLLISSGLLLYEAFRAALGEPITPTVLSALTWPLAAGLTAGVLLAYHLRTLRGDSHARTTGAVDGAGPVHAEALLILVRGAEPPVWPTAGTALARSLPLGSDVTLLPAGSVTPGEVRAWLAARTSPAPAPEPPRIEPPLGDRLAVSAPPIP